MPTINRLERPALSACMTLRNRAGKRVRPDQGGRMTEQFEHYDSRFYRTLDVAAGYAFWAPFYDATMDDRLDLPLLRSLSSVDWRGIAAAIDLGCGTGRIGAWL